MRKLALTIRLLYRIMAIGLLCVFANTSEVGAAEGLIRIVQNGVLKNNLVMRFQAEGLFTEKVTKFLNRGFTVKVEYNIELWRNRSYWFDRLDSQHSISYQINFEPLEKRYVCRRTQQGTATTSKTDKQLDEIIQWVTHPKFLMTTIPLGELNPQSKYYYNIEVIIATLTAENIRDLQRWINEFGEKDEEPSSLAKTSFKVVADFLSSKNHKKISMQSEQFYPYDLPKLSK